MIECSDAVTGLHRATARQRSETVNTFLCGLHDDRIIDGSRGKTTRFSSLTPARRLPAQYACRSSDDTVGNRFSPAASVAVTIDERGRSGSQLPHP